VFVYKIESCRNWQERLSLATLGVAPERIHVEIFNGSESITPGFVGAATRAPHVPRTTPAPVRWFRSRAAASAHTGRDRPTRAYRSWRVEIDEVVIRPTAQDF